MSDSHTKHEQVKIDPCDILIHSGDYTDRGSERNVRSFFEWFIKQPATYKVFIEGNHDLHSEARFNWETKADTWFSKMLEDYKINTEETNTYRLFNSGIELMGLNIWGSPITPSFHREGWAHNADRGMEIKQYWDQIPTNSDIVVTHGPVSMIGDYVPYNGGQFVGCADLDYKLREVKPILHVCGHIHCGYSITEQNGIMYANSAVCDESYKVSNKPHTITLNI